jgi:hypothetical protein
MVIFLDLDELSCSLNNVRGLPKGGCGGGHLFSLLLISHPIGGGSLHGSLIHTNGQPCVLRESSKKCQMNEFWIYSEYGEFYLESVSYASLTVDAENPRKYSYVNPPNYTLRKSAKSCSPSRQSCTDFLSV